MLLALCSIKLYSRPTVQLTHIRMLLDLHLLLSARLTC